MKKIIPLIVALILGLVVAYKVLQTGPGQPANVVAALERPTIVVAKRNVDPGELLTADKLTTSTTDAAPADGTAFVRESDVVGRVATIPIVSGQTIAPNMLAPTGTGIGLQAAVPEDMRAVSIEVNEFSGVAGYLVPGCRVDVLQTMRDDRTGEAITRTILEDIAVATIGPRRTDDQTGAPLDAHSVTMLVSPHQAEILELASSSGRPRLALRSSGDRDMTRTAPVTLTELKTGGVPAAPQTPIVAPVAPAPMILPVSAATQPAPKQWTMEVIRGQNVSETKFLLPDVETDAGTQMPSEP